MSGKLRTAILAAAALGLATSCAKEREPRSYVQPNLLAKKDLTGNWYYAPTVVDIGFGSAATFIGETGMDISIIKWDVQENTLYARLAYDRIRGTEANHNPLDGVAYKGEPIGAWSIQHIDIIRDYNATTGEEINVIRESQERPWYEREFLRVNWAENLVSNWAWIWQRIARFDPISYFQTDPTHPHATKIERDAAGLAAYIGVTSKVLMTPEMREYGYDGIPEIPDCYFYGQTTSCTSTEVVVRHSFVRVDPDHEYETRNYTQKEMDDYGFFSTQRLTYNRDYEITVGGITWYANRHNLYKEWFQKAYTVAEASLYAGSRTFTCAGGGEPCRFDDDNSKVFITGVRATKESEVPIEISTSGDAMDEYYCRVCAPNATECVEECFFVMDGSPVFYPTASGSEKVLIRPKDRPLKQLTYYLNETFPADLLPTARSIAKAWSKEFNRAVWMAAGCDPDSFESRICPTRPEFQDPSFEMLVLCENPVVKDGDPEVCGPVGREVRIGDLRYNHLIWVDAPQQSSPLGYGPPMGDPLTGETISAIANIYGSALDSYSVYARDMVRMVTDSNFEWSKYLTGKTQTAFVQATGEGGSYEAPQPNSLNKRGTTPAKARPNRAQRTWTQDDVRKIFGAMDKSFAAGVPTTSLAMPKTAKEIEVWMKARLGNITRSGVLGNGTNPQQGRINALRDSSLEDLMMTPNHLATYAQDLMAAGYDPAHVSGADLPRGSDIRKRVSPLTRLNIKYLRAINNVKYSHFAKKGCVMYSEFMPFDDPSIVGTASDLVCGLCCDDSARDASGNCPGIDACKASADEQTARWEIDDQCGNRVKQRLREMIFDGVTLHEMGHNMGLRHNFKGSYDAMNYYDRYWEIRKMDGTIHQRAVDPRTPAENLAGIANYQSSSIMDYGAKFNSDFMGLGRWDTAAILYGYAGFKQVFKKIEAGQFQTLGTIQNFRSFSWPTPFDFSGLVAINYTRLHYDPENPGVTPNGIVDTRESNRTWVPSPYLKEQRFGGTGGDLVWVVDEEIEARLGGGGENPRPMVPYKFCSDEFRGSSLGCNYFDEGADLYEIAENWMKSYESYYLFNNFGRDRYEWGWDPNQYTGRIYGRYFDGLQNHLQYYVLFLTILYDYGYWTAAQIENFFTDLDTGWGGYTLAVARSLDMFTRVLNQPQAGNYGLRTRMDGTPYYYMELEPEWVDGCVTDFCIPYIDGKMWEDSWDQDFGYQWYLRKIRYGHFYDRPLAIQVLGEATNNFMGRDTQGDVRKYTINYARLYPDTLKAVLAGINNQYLESSEFALDGNPFAPIYCGKDGAGDAIIDMRDASQPWRQPCEVTGGTPEGNIDPGDTFTTQLYATTLGLAYFPMSYSQEFLDAARIYVSGSGEGIDWTNIPAEAEVVEFTDPFSYKTYQAVKYPDVNIGNKNPAAPSNERVWVSASIGATMLLQAQEIAAIYTAAAAAYEATPNANTQTDLYYAKQNLQNYIINLDMARSTSFLYEHPDFTLDPQ